jgi:hypothetical protein
VQLIKQIENLKNLGKKKEKMKALFLPSPQNECFFCRHRFDLRSLKWYKDTYTVVCGNVLAFPPQNECVSFAGIALTCVSR